MAEDSRAPRVFISYAHESDEHVERVRLGHRAEGGGHVVTAEPVLELPVERGGLAVDDAGVLGGRGELVGRQVGPGVLVT